MPRAVPGSSDRTITVWCVSETTPDVAGPSVPGSRAVNINVTVRTMLLIAFLVALAWAFIYISEVVMTLFLSLFFALVFEPVVRGMQRKLPMGRGACATTLVLGLITLGVVFVLLLLSPLVGTFQDFVDQLPEIIDDIGNNSSIGSWVDSNSTAPESAQANAKEIAQGIAGAAGGVLGVIISGFSLVLALVTAIFLTLFLMIDLPRLIGAVDTLLDPRGSDRWNRMSERIITAVSRTMLGNIAISIICGTIYGVSAWLLGTPFPVVLGVISGLLDLIPMVGATIAGAIMVLATLTQGLTPALIMLAIVLVYQQFENYVLQPTILGKAANVSGFFVIVSVMIFGALMGVVGAIIAVPIIASIQIVVIELTKDRRAKMEALRPPGDPPIAAA
jgi:predicted PurR-regulated permease PerM